MVLIKGLEKMTLVDFPGKVAATIFLPGCNFRCQFCHNPELVLESDRIETLDEKEVLDYLNSKRNWIDGVCISGGEPTLHKDLPQFAETLKKMGFLVKLDTNGTNPSMLEELIQKRLVDYVAMDIKAPLEKYESVTGVTANKEAINKSVELLKNGGLSHEFRTTVLPEALDSNDMESIGVWISGGKKYFLQAFQPSKHINNEMKEMSETSKEELKNLAKVAGKHIDCEVRK